jgi:hypothetical protein
MRRFRFIAVSLFLVSCESGAAQSEAARIAQGAYWYDDVHLYFNGWSQRTADGQRTASFQLRNDSAASVFYAGQNPGEPQAVVGFSAQELRANSWETLSLPFFSDEVRQDGLVGFRRVELRPGEAVDFHFTEKGDVVILDGRPTSIVIPARSRILVRVWQSDQPGAEWSAVITQPLP